MSTFLNHDEARELFLYAINDGSLYRQRIQPIITNLRKKVKKGIFKKDLAIKLFKYASDDAAKRYAKEFGGNQSGYIFTVPVRNDVARQMFEYYEYNILND